MLVPVEFGPASRIDAPKVRARLGAREFYGIIGAEQCAVAVVPQLARMLQIAGGPAAVGVADRAAFIDVCVSDVSGVLRLGGGCEARRQIVLNGCNEALFR